MLGSQTLHATGLRDGPAVRRRDGTGDPETDAAVIVYYGDGATRQGDVHEAMVFAASYQTPQVFFLQNNQWAISVPVATPVAQSRSSGRGARLRHAERARSTATTCSRATPSPASLDEARAGDGPRAIEAMTYRMGAHTTSDDPTKYRTADEEESWAERDPIARIARTSRAAGHPTHSSPTSTPRPPTSPTTCAAARSTCRRPTREPMFDHVYSEPHPLIDEQRAWLAEYEASLRGRRIMTDAPTRSAR